MSGQDRARRPLASNRYGRFSEDGREYVVTDPRVPRPWSNVIANPRSGLVVSHTGSGFSWVDNSQLATITRWQQDLVSDRSGKFLYVRDADSGACWSLSPAPTWAPLERYACRHGLGYTVFETARDGIAASWTLFADAQETAEVWLVELRDESGRARRLNLTATLEWCMGVSPAPRREFGRLFLETWPDEPRRAVFARSHMWDVPSKRWGHWNTSFPFVSAFAALGAPADLQGDKAELLGRYGDWSAPAALAQSRWTRRFGRHEDAVAALRVPVAIPARGAVRSGFVLATGASAEEAGGLLERLGALSACDASFERVRAGWRERLAAHRVETPDATLDALVNDWARYQAISARLWGRCGYYQQSGAFGFRDQLQDSQVWLTIDPERCRAQARLHAAHQFADGSAYHWWHPLTEQGHVTKMTDDRLWLPFVVASYLRETCDISILADSVPFLDEAQAPLAEHVLRAFRVSFDRTSPRGIPLIGAGDWNDGLSAMGLEGRGESVWLGHFLAGLLAEWSGIWARAGRADLAGEFADRRTGLVAAVNAHAWDGEWYLRGTLDDGTPLGSTRSPRGRIFLNAQTWAILSDVAPPDRAAACLRAVRDHLVSDAGALLLAPAFDRPVSEIGYITRYAPGVRENGGVYTHAAVWAIAAAAKARDEALVGRLLDAMQPATKDPERYWTEPYVLPGNVDGPDSPHAGRGGWTWYTGSAAWLHRIVTEWVLGVRPEWDGLRLDPCLPPAWRGARMTRPFRGGVCEIEIARDARPGVEVDGKAIPGNLVPAPERGRTVRVAVRVPEGRHISDY
jgi:cellobiose phosphorylase